MSEYLDFNRFTPKGQKTDVVDVYSKNYGDLLGVIKWFPRWRQYTFFPMPGTTWSVGCLLDVKMELVKLNTEKRRKDAAKKRPPRHAEDEPCNCDNGIGCVNVPYDQW